MKFTMPVAKRERLEQLLEYLGNTLNYSKKYDGNRAEDFKKCFDIESEWCWKYADLMLRGMKTRKMKYAERHHMVPRSFYDCGRREMKGCTGNMTKLSYGEHLYAHYCAAMCSKDLIIGDMASAFCYMYYRNATVRKMPAEQDIISSISEHEVSRIRGMIASVSRVEAEGRTHFFDDPVQARKDWWEQNRDDQCEKKRQRYEGDKDRILKKNKEWADQHPDKMREYKKKWSVANRNGYLAKYREENRDRLREYKRKWYHTHKDNWVKYREEHKEELKEYSHNHYIKNKESIKARNDEYVATHKEEVAERKRKWAVKNKDKVRHMAAARQKAYKERKKANGYAYKKDPVTGKHKWIFVGFPEPESTNVK